MLEGHAQRGTPRAARHISAVATQSSLIELYRLDHVKSEMTT